jgi:hypothetical protein
MNRYKRIVISHLLVSWLFFLSGTAPLCAQGPLSSPVTGLKNDSSKDYQYFDLACDVGAWGGYFAPDRWQKRIENAEPEGIIGVVADGGSPPNDPLVVLGKDTKVVETWSIEIPATGYLSFRLLSYGMGKSKPVQIRVNDRKVNFRLRSDGLYYSPYLRAGDRFSLYIPAGDAVYSWTGLLFHTNFTAVIVRPSETDPSLRYVPISEHLIERVHFLSEQPGSWPTFDQDGDLVTIDDQIELRESTERFSVSYSDEVVLGEEGFFLRRTFSIREKCSRGNWLKRSRIWARLPMLLDQRRQ